MIKIECKNALQEMLLIEELSKRKDVKVVTKETQLDEAASVKSVMPILTKIVDGLKTLNVTTKLDDVIAVFLHINMAGPKFWRAIEDLGFICNTTTYLENKDFYNKINLTKTEYDQLIKASRVKSVKTEPTFQPHRNYG